MTLPSGYDLVTGLYYSKERKLKVSRARNYTTNSLVRELRALGKVFDFFSTNVLTVEIKSFEIDYGKMVYYFICTPGGYKLRIDKFAGNSWGDFQQYEIKAKNGYQFLFVLVKNQILDSSWLPELKVTKPYKDE